MSEPAPIKRLNRRLLWQLSAFVAGSFAFGWALIPLYDVLCEVTGIGTQKNLTTAAAATPQIVSSPRCRFIQVRSTRRNSWRTT
jgi:cytochrome c oxidase assembly protein subunit 11